MRFMKSFFLTTFNNHLIAYPTPINIHYAWSFGFLSLMCLTLQTVTGIFLAMHYTPHIALAFSSVEHTMRDVNFGWLTRYTHANGASMFFMVAYIHIFRGLYFGSYTKPKQWVWLVGIFIFTLMIMTAFMGYVLPWGQMSLWGATVMTNLVSALPMIGDYMVFWLWGGFSVDNATLNRFFSLHYTLPFVITATSLVHITLTHQEGSGNPLGIDSYSDKVNLYPYFVVKDTYGLFIFTFLFSVFLFFYPNLLGHSDNYVEANPMVTPNHIVPEWYFLPFYAILRSVPHKLWGVIAMLSSIIILSFIPWLHSTETRSSRFRPIYKIFYWTLVFCCLLLGWIGGMPVEEPYITMGQVLSVYYFSYFLTTLPMLGTVENNLMNYFNK
uniref:apocytochrome b n=1 Tax=Bostrychia tenuissima TaxID=196631 RepID=UPI002E76477C|nr:apocytochrome b [Bostrychia tenuissima]WQF69436.1 apocytochrome b [Bostrychia tenuissima]